MSFWKIVFIFNLARHSDTTLVGQMLVLKVVCDRLENSIQLMCSFEFAIFTISMIQISNYKLFKYLIMHNIHNNMQTCIFDLFKALWSSSIILDLWFLVLKVRALVINTPKLKALSCTSEHCKIMDWNWVR